MSHDRSDGTVTVAAPASTPRQFAPGLGLFDAITIVVGVMIGSGIFIVSAEMARLVGSAGCLRVAWAIAGLLMIAGAPLDSRWSAAAHAAVDYIASDEYEDLGAYPRASARVSPRSKGSGR